MALNPNNRWPTKTIAPTGAYPYGAAQNITTTGDGTGTPFEDAFIDDAWGWRQRLLSEAGIVPSGDPDTALASQYLEAMGKLGGRNVETTGDLLTTDLTGAEVVTTSGYATIGDGGEAAWYSTGGVDVPSAGTEEFGSGLIYDSVGNEFHIVGSIRNPKQFGARGDGVTDDNLAINNAVNSLGGAGGIVYFSPGTYKVDDEILLSDKIILRGAGRSLVTLDFTGAPEGAFPDDYCIRAEGAIAALPDLSIDVAEGSTTLDFAAVHGLAADDIVVIWDPTDFSLNPARAYYRAGEMCQVAVVDDTDTVTISRPLYADYVAATVDVGRLVTVRVAIESMTVKGIDNTSTLAVIGVRFGRDCSFRNLHLSGSQWSCVETDRCYNVEFEDIIGRDYGPLSGLNYIVAISNTQISRATQLRGGSGRHYLTTGGRSLPWTIPVREVLITDCHVDEVSSGLKSIGFHGNTEFWTVANCTLGGAGIAGRFGRYIGCNIYAAGDPVVSVNAGSAITQAEMHGADHSLENCRIIANVDIGANTALVNLNDTSNALIHDGTTRFSSCVFDAKGFSGQVGKLFSRSTAADQSLIVDGCEFLGGGSSTSSFDVVQGSGTTSGWKSVVISNNVFKGVGLLVQGTEIIDITGNTSRDSANYGIRVTSLATAVPYTRQEVRISNNVVRRAQLAGIDVNNSTGAIAISAHISGNVSLDNNQSDAAVSDYSSLTMNNMQEAYLHSNTFGDQQSTTTQLRTWKVTNSTLVVANNTLALGALPTFFSGNTNFYRHNDRTDQVDKSLTTGLMGIAGGDPAVVHASGDDFVVGDGTGNRGLTVYSSATGVSRLTMGDPSDTDRVYFQCDHTNSELDVIIAGVVPLQCSATEVKPGSDGVFDLGLTSRRWAECWFTDIHTARRTADAGTALVPGDFVLSGGWGAGRSVDTVTGTDSACTVTIESGISGFSANPTCVLTFSDGSWTNGSPVSVVSSIGSNAAGLFNITSQNSVSVTITFFNTPAASTFYSFNLQVIGR